MKIAARACLYGIDGYRLATTTSLQERTELVALTELAMQAREEDQKHLAFHIAEYMLTGIFGE